MFGSHGRSVRARRAALAVGLAVGLFGLTPAPPASADPITDLLFGGSPTPAPSSPTPSAEQFAAWGSFTAPTYRVRKGCHDYAYTYEITPPEEEWAFEIFLTDPRGVGVASDVVIAGANPTSATRVFTLCQSTAVPGVYRITGRLTYDDYPDQYVGWVTPHEFTVKKAFEKGKKKGKKAKRRHR